MVLFWLRLRRILGCSLLWQGGLAALMFYLPGGGILAWPGQVIGLAAAVSGCAVVPIFYFPFGIVLARAQFKAFGWLLLWQAGRAC